MIVYDSDIEWLSASFPGLSYDPHEQVISGDLDFCGRYDSTKGLLHIEGAVEAPVDSAVEVRICDSFTVRIVLEAVGEFVIDWPTVYEIGGRCGSIGAVQSIRLQDMHIDSDGSCCLGIQTEPGPSDIQIFIEELVIPFFFRVAYIERFGIDKARRELWGGFRHGSDGLHDRLQEIYMARRPRNKPCSCGSGKKYKVCCLWTNQDRERSLANRLRRMRERVSLR